MLLRNPLLVASLALLAACGADGPSSPLGSPHDAGLSGYDLETLLDPATCAGCHPDHYREWAASMHAYASTDPVFRAMNTRGHRDTDGDLGESCLDCHAPLAAWLDLAGDGSDLDGVPAWAQGVTCAFCHRVVALDWFESPPVVLATDGDFRGGIDDPIPNDVHGSRWSPLHDRRELESVELCSPCHDRSHLEWTQTLFNDPDPQVGLTCGDCHMPAREGPATAEPGAPQRTLHSHLWPGVDVALSPWPDHELMVEEVQRSLDTSLRTRICVYPLTSGDNHLTVTLENISSGHDWPSCSKDRRAWVELTAWDGEGRVLLRSGDVAEGQSVTAARLEDPGLWVIGDWFYGPDGEEVVLPWEAVGFEKNTVPAPTALDANHPLYVDPHLTRSWVYSGPAPAVVEARVHLRPVPLDLVDSLIESGDLDPAVRDLIPVWTPRYAERIWEAEAGLPCIPVLL